MAGKEIYEKLSSESESGGSRVRLVSRWTKGRTQRKTSTPRNAILRGQDRSATREERRGQGIVSKLEPGGKSEPGGSKETVRKDGLKNSTAQGPELGPEREEHAR